VKNFKNDCGAYDMAKKEPTIEVFEGDIAAEPCFFWHLRAKNGEIVCVSQGYDSYSNAKRGATRAVELFADAVLVERK
jgi:uncharacterized protein YegP (UPF0339 family)